MGIARSGIGWLIAKYGTLGLSLVATMYFARALTSPNEVLGQFYIFETVVSLGTFLAISGLGSALTKRVSEGDDQGAFVGSALAMVGCLTFLMTLLILLLREFVSDYFGIGLVAVGFVVAMVWAMAFRNVLTAGLRGFSMVGRSGGISFVEISLRTAVQVVLVFFGFALVGLMTGAVVGTAVAAVLALYFIPVRIDPPRREHARSLISFGKYSFLQGVSGRFYDNVDTIVIATFLGQAATGTYNVAFRFSLALSIFSGAISTSTLPEISRHASSGNLERVETILTDGLVFATLLALPATVGMALLAEPIIVTFFTPKFEAGALVAVVAVAIQIPDGFRTVFSSAIDGMDRPDLTLRADVIVIIVNGLLDLILVPIVGIEGAAVASFLAIASAGGYLGYAVFSHFDLPLGVFPVRPLAAELAATLFMGATVYLLRGLVSMPQLLEVLFLVAVGVVVYMGVLLAISSSVRVRVLGIVDDVVPF